MYSFVCGLDSGTVACISNLILFILTQDLTIRAGCSNVAPLTDWV